MRATSAPPAARLLPWRCFSTPHPLSSSSPYPQSSLAALPAASPAHPLKYAGPVLCVSGFFCVCLCACVHVLVPLLACTPANPSESFFFKSFVNCSRDWSATTCEISTFPFLCIVQHDFYYFPKSHVISVSLDLYGMLRSPWILSTRLNDGCCKFLSELKPHGRLGHVKKKQNDPPPTLIGHSVRLPTYVHLVLSCFSLFGTMLHVCSL